MAKVLCAGGWRWRAIVVSLCPLVVGSSGHHALRRRRTLLRRRRAIVAVLLWWWSLVVPVLLWRWSRLAIVVVGSWLVLVAVLLRRRRPIVLLRGISLRGRGTIAVLWRWCAVATTVVLLSGIIRHIQLLRGCRVEV